MNNVSLIWSCTEQWHPYDHYCVGSDEKLPVKSFPLLIITVPLVLQIFTKTDLPTSEI